MVCANMGCPNEAHRKIGRVEQAVDAAQHAHRHLIVAWYPFMYPWMRHRRHLSASKEAHTDVIDLHTTAPCQRDRPYTIQT